MKPVKGRHHAVYSTYSVIHALVCLSNGSHGRIYLFCKSFFSGRFFRQSPFGVVYLMLLVYSVLPVQTY
ncbi:hypothetical protein Barb4_03924 [Bacteroidales bacterium Barb4]|nr:hypothetical protein Barb4_03924 [Bacteroidales bacterium Barb4]